MIRALLILVALLGLSLSVVGCTHTVRGMGSDFEKAGESMQDYNQK